MLELLGRTGASGAAGANRADHDRADHDRAVDGPAGDASADEGLVHLRHRPARPATTVAPPDDLPASLRARLAHAGIDRLWSHQAEALDRARQGEHLVIATGTASGKSLAYQLPVVERLLSDNAATALYLAPTKALAHDQLRAIRAMKLPQVRAAVLDGDVEQTERDAIRKTANWVLTNPDLLHRSLLPNHRLWADLLHRLAFVIVDESHVARGVFGGHVALVLRRLRRLVERYSGDPTFLLASATIGNPGDHAGALTGLQVGEVLRDGSPRGPLDIGLWRPPFLDLEPVTDGDADTGSGATPGAAAAVEEVAAGGEPARRSLLRETGDLLASFVAADIQTLVFTRSRKGAEVVALTARERLGDARDASTGRLLADAVSAYRAGYLADERRDLEDRLRRGELRGVAATEALELGIDVSGLDAVILAGWPGTTSSFWQRLGRAGRTGGAAAGLFVAQEDPLDNYLVTHPDELFTREPEDAILDPANPYLLAPHLRCACQEAPLDDDDAGRWFGPAAAALLAADVATGLLRRRGDLHYWTSRQRAAARVNLRSIGGEPVRIVDGDTGVLIGDVDASRAHRQVHTGAMYLHRGRRFEVQDLDLERHLAIVRDASSSTLTTRPRSETDVRVLDEQQAVAWDAVQIRLGRVEVTSRVTGYDVLRIGSAKVLERIDLDLPPLELRTVAVWYTIPDGLLDDAGIGPTRVPGSLHAAEHAAIGMLPLLALCDRWDLGGLSTARHPDTDRPTVFVYDGYPGGAGLAQRSFERLPEHLALTRRTIASCRCRDGCPSCVQSPKCGNGNDPLDKPGANAVLDLLLARAPGGPAHPSPAVEVLEEGPPTRSPRQ